MRDARRAGPNAASADTASRIAAMAANVSMSAGARADRVVLRSLARRESMNSDRTFSMNVLAQIATWLLPPGEYGVRRVQ
jgi:hypothetical protein